MSTLTSFSGLLVPEFAESEGAGARGRMSRIASESMNMTLTYSVAAAVLLYLFGEELGYAVYGSYHAGYYICMLSLVVPIMYLDHVTDSILKGIGEQVYSMWVNITDSILSVVLVWLPEGFEIRAVYVLKKFQGIFVPLGERIVMAFGGDDYIFRHIAYTPGICDHAVIVRLRECFGVDAESCPDSDYRRAEYPCAFKHALKHCWI